MAKDPFRKCEYCGSSERSNVSEPRFERRAWTLFPATRKMCCPRCEPRGREENRLAYAMLMRHAGLLQNRMLAEPDGRYGTQMTRKGMMNADECNSISGDPVDQRHQRSIQEENAVAEPEVPYGDAFRRQFGRIKAKYPEAILWMRDGDFMKVFGEDAAIMRRALDLVLTRTGQSFPFDRMVEFHVDMMDTYLPKMVRAGYRVAICDQLEGPPVPGLLTPAPRQLYGQEHPESVVAEPVEQYRRIKPLYRDALLILRDHMGYLMLYRDAERAATVLGVEYKGVEPFRLAHHILGDVLDKLVAANYRVAVVCDPIVDDPRNARQVDMYDVLHEQTA